MKQNRFVREAGPYRVVSQSQGDGEVRLVVYPRHPKYGDWPEQRKAQQGGGPGIFTNIALAEALESFLNQAYNRNDVECWRKRIDALAGLADAAEAVPAQHGVLMEPRTAEMFIPMTPEAKGRPRSRIQSRGLHQYVQTYTPSATAHAERLIREYARQTQVYFDRKTPLDVSMTFCLVKPPSAPKKRCWPTVKPDIDNLAKLVMDGINGLWFPDDAQVVRLTLEKRYVADGRGEGIRVTVSEVQAVTAQPEAVLL